MVKQPPVIGGRGKCVISPLYYGEFTPSYLPYSLPSHFELPG